jgi:hypothetical protein
MMNKISETFTVPHGAGRMTLERVAGIEPASSAWKAVTLPLSYTRRACAIAIIIM